MRQAGQSSAIRGGSRRQRLCTFRPRRRLKGPAHGGSPLFVRARALLDKASRDMGESDLEGVSYRHRSGNAGQETAPPASNDETATLGRLPVRAPSMRLAVGDARMAGPTGRVTLIRYSQT